MEAKQLFDQVNTYFGFKVPLISFEVFQSWLPIIENYKVVCSIGLLDSKRTHLYDVPGVLMQAAILLKKKTYVYDEDTEQWYVARLYQQKTKKDGMKTWQRFVRSPRPKATYLMLSPKDALDSHIQKII